MTDLHILANLGFPVASSYFDSVYETHYEFSVTQRFIGLCFQIHTHLTPSIGYDLGILPLRLYLCMNRTHDGWNGVLFGDTN